MKEMHIKGGRPLYGEVVIAGAKNAASKMIIATLLTDEKVILHNVPLQQETDIAKELIETTGSICKIHGHVLQAHLKKVQNISTKAQSRKNRLSILLAAPLLHRAGEARVARLGGDKIGPRPVNFHIEALQKMGAQFSDEGDSWLFKSRGRLQGVQIELPYPSVGATETMLFAGVLAKGNTVIYNAAIEPEIMELIMMLQKMGAIISVGAHRTIRITGVDKLHGCEHRILPDRLEAASYACIALATKGEIFCKGAKHDHMITFLNAVRMIGGEYDVRPNGILFRGSSEYKPVSITTDTFPGFATDWQQPFVVVMTQAMGSSMMHETVYQDRFRYTETLNRMGANITIDYMPDTIRGKFQLQNYKQSAIIYGPTPLTGTKMTVPDIRAGLAYVAAALVADDISILDGIEHLERGYEDLHGKLASIGADIQIK